LDDTKRYSSVPAALWPEKPLNGVEKKSQKITFNDSVYVSHDRDSEEKSGTKAQTDEMSSPYEPTEYLVSQLRDDDLSYYRENQYATRPARFASLLEKKDEQLNEVQPSEELEETNESESTGIVTLPEGPEFSRVFSRSPSADERKGKSVFRWNSDARQSKWLALHSRAAGSDEAMRNSLTQAKSSTPDLDRDEKLFIGNTLIPLETEIGETKDQILNEKTRKSFTPDRARKETRLPTAAHTQLRSTITEVRNSDRPSLSKLTLALAEFSLTINSKRDEAIAKSGKNAIKAIIKKREALMRKSLAKA
jgi:hypothetical protein